MTAAAALTAHIGYEPATRRPGSHEVYHAVLGQDARLGLHGDRKAGEPVCGHQLAALAGCPPGLFPAVVTCPACRAVCAREGITTGGPS